MKSDWVLETVKVVVPAVLSSVLVTFYFQKRLKRMGDFQDATKMLLERLLSGAEDVFDRAQKLDVVLRNLGKELDRVPLDEKELRHISSTLRYASGAFLDALKVHRIYITSFAPYGISNTYSDTLTAIRGYLELLVEADDPNKDKMIHKIRLQLATSMNFRS